jgi:hypothetical protein
LVGSRTSSRRSEFAGVGVDDADVAVLDEHEDVGSGVGLADADGVELAVVAECDLAGFVDAVVADAVVGVVAAVTWGGGFGSAGVDRGRGGLVVKTIPLSVNVEAG